MGRLEVNEREEPLKGFMKAALAVTLVAACVPATASAEPGATLDGVPTSVSAALADDHPCTTGEDGGYVCFSSEEARIDATTEALETGVLPAGYKALPPQARLDEVLDSLQAARAGDQARSTSATALDACPRDNTNWWTGGSFNDNHGYSGYTGTGYYMTFGSTVWDNDVTSFKHGLYSTIYANRTDFVDEKYYGGQALCSENASLVGDYWNNRFGSVQVY
jgi:hypothetical protein